MRKPSHSGGTAYLLFHLINVIAGPEDVFAVRADVPRPSIGTDRFTAVGAFGVRIAELYFGHSSV